MNSFIRRAMGAVLLLGATLLVAGCYKVPGEFLMFNESTPIPYTGGPVSFPMETTATFKRSGVGFDYTYTTTNKKGNQSTGNIRFHRVKGDFFVAQTGNSTDGYYMFIFRITDKEMKVGGFADDNAVKAEAAKMGLTYSSESSLSSSSDGSSSDSEAGFTGSVSAMRKFLRSMPKFEYTVKN